MQAGARVATGYHVSVLVERSHRLRSETGYAQKHATTRRVERAGRTRARSDMYFLKDFVDQALGCDCLKLAEEQAL